jgi:hypothetical protein
MADEGFEGCTDEELVAMLGSLERQHRALAASRAEVVEALDRRRVFRRDGHATVHGLVRTVTRCPTRESKDLLRTGRLLREHPEIAESLAAGELGVAQAHLLGEARAHPRCGDQFAEIAEALVEAARTLKFSELETLIGSWIAAADMDGANRDAAEAHAGRDAFIHVGRDGFLFEAKGSALTGSAIKEVLERFTQAEFDKDWAWAKEEFGEAATGAQLPRSDRQRRADALMAVFEAAVCVPADARAPEPVVNLVGDAATFAKVLAIYFGLPIDAATDEVVRELVPLSRRRCATTSGVPVAPNDLLAAAIVGHVRRVVLDSRSVVIDLGRTRRLFTGAARFAAHFGRSRCYWPGCEVPAARCQTDHLEEWQHHGTTSPGCGAPGCPHHNRFKTNRGYRVTRSADGGLHVVRPDGTEVA